MCPSWLISKIYLHCFHVGRGLLLGRFAFVPEANLFLRHPGNPLVLQIHFLSMDTISRENSSMLPVGGIIVGAIGLLLGGLALVQVSKVNKTVAEHQSNVDKVAGLEGQVAAASSAAEKARSDVASLQRSTQSAFDTVGPELARISGAVTKLEESAKRPAVAASKKGEPAVAGPGEYVIKPGDTGMKIASANGVTFGDLQTVNPGVSWTGLRPGQKLKMPKK